MTTEDLHKAWPRGPYEHALTVDWGEMETSPLVLNFEKIPMGARAIMGKVAVGSHHPAHPVPALNRPACEVSNLGV